MNDNSTNNGLRKLQLAELEVLKEIKKICDENNIEFYMLGGTFLGAVRHKGFIPWDDDIDIGMPRKDFERFCEIASSKNIDTKYRLQTFQNDPNYLYYVPKFVDESVKIIDNSAKNSKQREAWVDIFPIDGMPNNGFLRKMHQFRLLALRAIFKFSVFDDIVAVDLPNRPVHEKILIFIGKHTGIKKIFKCSKCLDKLDASLKKYKYEDSKYVVNFMGAYKFKEMFEKKIYEEIAEYDFEDLKLKAPKNYDKFLSQMYGDYMKLPPDAEKNKHSTELLEEE